MRRVCYSARLIKRFAFTAALMDEMTDQANRALSCLLRLPAYPLALANCLTTSVCRVGVLINLPSKTLTSPGANQRRPAPPARFLAARS